MPAVEKRQSQTVLFEEIRIETNEHMNCFRIREKLDALFNGELFLEETPAGTKRSLFSHLDSCRNCCRAFDARVRFRPAGSAKIY